MNEFVSVKKNEGIAVLMLTRPEAFNAFNLEMAAGLSARLVTLAVDQEVRGIILSGEGKAFCAGGDLKWVQNYPLGPSAGFHELAAHFHQAILEIRRMAKPVIAAINGIAAGGGFSLALACDFRIMDESAQLRQAYTSNGLCIDGGGSFTLPRLVGSARAMEIMAFDRPIPPEQAFAWGLVTKIAGEGKALEEAHQMARELGCGSLNSFGWSKLLITDSFNSSFETHIERERRALSLCAAHPDGQEGLKAFSEKRKPDYRTKR